MTAVPAHFQLSFAPVADPAAIVAGPNARFTVLTSRLLRLEYSPTGHFEDRASQPFWFRRQPVPAFDSAHEGDAITIDTGDLRLTYSGGAFSADTLSITVQQTGTTWHYGADDTGNLLGTTRTLDGVAGDTELESGLLSRQGWAVYDDSHSLVFNDEAWLVRRETPGTLDLYFFGYGTDYTAALLDFQKIAGGTPLLPRWVLGNWWSRYWEYTEDSLRDLMTDFRAHDIPLSVCIIDMDWHITDTGNASNGWTGYTWNHDYFPDPERLIDWLHQQGLKTALNLHPASGVWPHEAQYAAMAEAVGIDPASKEPVPFDIADPTFAMPYFELLHHPKEAQGLDFWWMDWQQGKISSVAGLDPLWWLNHLHFYDLGRDGVKRPFVFSRWGGLGNHRYPIGFSGDSMSVWESLAFQPYFTATAANVGYGWWSHDIGGHFSGTGDGELYARWLQYGVFSPIMRLHTSKNPYQERRPWGYDARIFEVSRTAMQLRHALIPYLYTMSWRNATAGIPPVQPMYHLYPDDEAAYACPDQYTFGSELIAAPYITPSDPDTRLSRQVMWLPEGDWFGLFDGWHYGGGWHALYGTLDEIPVFARAGAIVPLGPKVGWGGVDNPDQLDLHIFPGAENVFRLYEDDGHTTAYQDGAYAITTFSQTWADGRQVFTIEPAQGQPQVLERRYDLHFRGITEPATVTVDRDGAPVVAQTQYEDGTLHITGLDVAAGSRLTVYVNNVAVDRRDRKRATCLKMLDHFALNTLFKHHIFDNLDAILADVTQLLAFDVALTDSQIRALTEVITGAGMTRMNYPQPYYVLWNNTERPDFTYHLTGWNGHRWQRYEEAGTLPAFSRINPTEIGLEPWKLRVNYAGLLHLSEEERRYV